MQPQHGYLRKLTRLGLALIAIAMLTLPASASAVLDAQQLRLQRRSTGCSIVTAGSKKDAVTDAGVDAIKAIGKDTGAGGKFSVFVAGNAEQINDQFTDTAPRPLPRRRLPEHRPASCSTTPGRPLSRPTSRRWRLCRHRLGDRDRPTGRS